MLTRALALPLAMWLASAAADAAQTDAAANAPARDVFKELVQIAHRRGPGLEDQCRAVVAAMRQDGRVQSITD